MCWFYRNRFFFTTSTVTKFLSKNRPGHLRTLFGSPITRCLNRPCSTFAGRMWYFTMHQIHTLRYIGNHFRLSKKSEPQRPTLYGIRMGVLQTEIHTETAREHDSRTVWLHWRQHKNHRIKATEKVLPSLSEHSLIVSDFDPSLDVLNKTFYFWPTRDTCPLCFNTLRLVCVWDSHKRVLANRSVDVGELA